MSRKGETMEPTQTSVSSQNQPNGTEVSNKPPRENFLLIAIILAFLAVFFAVGISVGTYLTRNQEPPAKTIVSTPTAVPATNPTATWKTFTNSQYGYFFRYPDTRYVTDNDFKNIYLSFKDKKKAIGERAIVVSVSNTPQEDFLKQHIKLEIGADNSQVKPEPYNLGGIEGIKIIVNTAAGTSEFYIFARYKNSSYIIGGPAVFETSGKKEMDQILSTFKFLDQTETSGMENWKTYSSSKYSFMFQYPNSVSLTDREGEGVFLTLWGPTQRQGTEFHDGISLSFKEKLLKGQTVQDIANSEVSSGIEVLQPPNPVLIGGVTGTKFKVRGLGDFTYTLIPLKNDRYLEIVDSTEDPTGQGYPEIVNKIFSTFQFTQ